MKRCRNPLCLEPDKALLMGNKRWPLGLCPSCRRMFFAGMAFGSIVASFAGMVAVVTVRLLKLL